MTANKIAYGLGLFALFGMLELCAAEDYDFTGIFPPEIKTVYIVAPSDHADNDTVIAATNELVRCGYKVKVHNTVWNYSSDAAVRAQGVMDAWKDPETDLILCSRGGSGGAATAANLDYDILKSRDLPFVGFSNISALMNAFVRKGVKRPITGPMCTTLVNYPNTRDSVLRLGATVGRYDLENTQLTVRRAPESAVSGLPIGGHWPSITGLSNSLFPDTSGRIIFIECNSSYTYATAVAQFESLKSRGYFTNPSAVVICDVSLKGAPADDEEAVRQYITTNLNCAVFSGYPYGHVSKNYAIDFGRMATISTTGLLSWESYSTNVVFDAKADTTTNVTEVLSGDLHVYVNTNANSSGTVCLSGANTYSGTTTLKAGTLEAPLLAPEYQASSLGNRGTLEIQGGTFRYTGATAATFGHAISSGSDACAIENDADLTFSGMWTASGTITKNGAGTLALSGTGNTFAKDVTVHAGTLALTDGASTFSGYIYVNDSTGDGEAAKTRLLVTGGTHDTDNVYIGQNSAMDGGEYWADFIMTGGTLTTGDGNSLFIGNQDVAHVNVDISGGTLNIGKHISVCYGTASVAKDINITIRDSAIVHIPNKEKYFYFNGSKTKASLTVRDGGTLDTPCICRYTSGSASPTVLFDGGNLQWNAMPRVFTKSGSASSILTKPICIGTKGAAFTGVSSTQFYRYEVALIASNTVDGVAAEGVSFATGTYSLEIANSWSGPTLVKGDASLLPGAANSLPSTSLVTVEQGGTLALTNVSQACAGIVLNGNLDLLSGQTLALGSEGATGSGTVTLYTDAARKTVLDAVGTYPIMTAPFAQRGLLESFAQTAKLGNVGGFEIADDGTTATLSLKIAGTCEAPDCLIEGTNDASTVTFSCRGEIETVGGVKYLKPGVTSSVSATDSTGGLVVGGWRDESTGDFYWGEVLQVTPTNHTTFTAVFGRAWFWDASAKTISDGSWTFAAQVDSSDSSKLVVTEVSATPGEVSPLNFATPITNATGATFAISILGNSLDEDEYTLFGETGWDKGKYVGKLYLGAAMTQIGCAAFTRCSNLVGRVTTPTGLTTIGPRAFCYCVGIEAADLLDVRTICPPYALAHCYALKTVRLSNELSTLGRYSFNNDSALTTITPFLPDPIKEIGRATFYKCSSLKGDLRLLNAKRICYSAFYSASKINSVTLPSVTNIGYQSFCSVGATNYVFGTDCVHFIDEEYKPTSSSHRGYGYQPLYVKTDVNRHFVFPGKAPDLREVVAESHATGTNQLFGSSKQSGKTILHGSWRTDPEGWQKIIDEVGSTDISGKTAPELGDDDRSVKGVFNWYQSGSNLWGWLIDTKMPDEPPYGMQIILK